MKLSQQSMKGYVLVLAGSFGEQDGNWTHQNIARWVSHAGGRVVQHLTDDTTHLVCSKKSYQKKVPVVVQAATRSDIKIVGSDWLLDSLLTGRRYAEGRYLMVNIASEAQQRKRQRRQARKRVMEGEAEKFRSGAEVARSLLLMDNYHIYRDPTGFVYDVKLFRSDISSGEYQRYILRIFEANAPPFLYAATMTFKASEKPDKNYVLANAGTEFDKAYEAFKFAFRAKTNVDWDFRVWNRPVLSPYARKRLTTTTSNSTIQEILTAQDHGDSPSAIIPITINSDDERSDPEDEPRKRLAKRAKREFRKVEREAKATIQNRYYRMQLPDGISEPIGYFGLYRFGLERFGEPPNDLEYVGGTLALIEE